MNKKEFVKEVNTKRLQNKGSWYYWNGVVENKNIQIKAFDTWLQIFNINGINYSYSMDISVAEFKQCLENSV